MKIDFSQTFVEPNGATVKLNEGRKDEFILTLGRAVLEALNTPSGETLTLDMACKRGNLAMLVGLGGSHDITPEEASLMRAQLPFRWSPIIVAQAAAMLDPKEKESEDVKSEA